MEGLSIGSAGRDGNEPEAPRYEGRARLEGIEAGATGAALAEGRYARRRRVRSFRAQFVG